MKNPIKTLIQNEAQTWKTIGDNLQSKALTRTWKVYLHQWKTQPLKELYHFLILGFLPVAIIILLVSQLNDHGRTCEGTWAKNGLQFTMTMNQLKTTLKGQPIVIQPGQDLINRDTKLKMYGGITQPPNTNPDWNIIGLTCKYNLQGIKDKISQTLEKQNSPAQPTPYTPNENPAWNWTPPKPAT